MLEFFTSVGIEIFNYFFKINAPFTIILLVFGSLLISMWRKSGKAAKININHAIASEVFNAQMDHYDDSIGEVEQLLRSNFMSLRKHTLIDQKIGDKDITKAAYKKIEDQIKRTLGNDSEIHRFNEILGNVKTSIKPIFRRIYKANHLADKKHEEFELHIATRVNHIIAKFTEELDERYWEGTKPDRVTLYDSQQLLIPKVEDILKSILRHGREISIEFKKHKELRSEHFLNDAIKG